MDFQQRMMQQAQPSLSDAIALGKAGDQAGMQRMMQQIVGLPPSGAPQQMQAAQQREMQKLASQQMALQAPYTNMQMSPQEMQMREAQQREMQMRLAQQAAMGMGPQQPGMQQTVGPGLTPQGNLFNPAQPQPGFLGSIQPGQMGQDLYGRPMQLPQQPMQQPPQQFGQAQNPFAAGTLGQNPYARPMQQQTFGQAGMPQPMQTAMPQGIGQSLQQSSGQTQQQPSNIMGSKFGSAFGGGTQPQQQQPQQPGMQQNSPMQKASGSTGRTGLF
jgi:hypothetical protein